MRYKLLGRSGLRVAEFALGTMTFGEGWGWGASQEESQRIFDAYVQAGGNFIDTANNYTNGTSERYVGEMIAGDRAYFVLATKYTLTTRKDDPNAGGNHRKNMMQSVEASLKRLGTEYIDLLWLHAWDHTTPVDEVMRGLDDLVRAGKVHYIGISDTPAWLVARANTLAELRGWSCFAAVQAPYSLFRRDVERELLPMARSLDLALTAWGTMAGGVLTGKYGGAAGGAGGTARFSPQKVNQAAVTVGDAVAAVAARIGRPPSQVAINWVRQQPGLIIPILGARTAAQIRDNLGCLDFSLTDEELVELSAASPIDLGFPHAFLAGPEVRNLIFGEMEGRLDNHRAR